jgi:hypothetical protein
MNDPSHTSEEIYDIGLFEAAGIELEYMIVDSMNLDVLPICDSVLHEISGTYENEVYPDGESGFSAWSNELALHVIEFKSLKPVTDLSNIGGLFQKEVTYANSILKKYNARLLPTAMHPWMNPEREFKIWPHGNREIYNTFDRIFGCRGHGWSNLQSMHINLPFMNNDEFVKLHTAIRILLPMINALSASSPFIEGRFSGFYDTRVEVYRTNSIIIPSITGKIIPEPVTGIDDYRDHILSRIYSDLSKYDPDKIISHEWVNARGCIARFERGTIEIRTCDIQECPAADIACAKLIIAILKKLVNEEISTIDEQLNLNTESLYNILLTVIKKGSDTIIDNYEYLRIFGLKKPCTALQFWKTMHELYFFDSIEDSIFLSHIFKYGNLSERIIRAAGETPSKERLFSVYKELSLCLSKGIQYSP